MPVGFPTFREGLRAGAEIFHALRSILKTRGLSTGVGDEGGFAPSLRSNREAVEVVLEAIGKAGAKAGENVFIALDRRGERVLRGRRALRVQEVRRAGTRDSAGMVALYVDWVRQYPIISIEDGCAEQRLGRLEAADRRRSATACSWSATTCSSPIRRSCSKGIDEGVAQRAAGEAEPDRHGHRNARRHGHGQRRRLPQRHLAPLRRNRGLDHRRPRGRHRRRPDQDRLGVAQRSRGQVQPVAADRRRARRAPRGMPAAPRSSSCSNPEPPCTNSFCSATANRPGTRRTASRAGPTSTSPTRAARKRGPPGGCSSRRASRSTWRSRRC